MIKRKEWAISKLVGLVLMVIGFIISALATQGLYLSWYYIGLISLLTGSCLFIYSLFMIWLNNK